MMEGLIGFGLLLALIGLRVPIGLAMAAVGLVGACWMVGSAWPVLAQLKHTTYSTFANYSLAVIPLFLLMGQLASAGGLSQRLFDAARSWLGHYRGGLAMAAVGACAGFGSICGSSLATAATMGQVAIKPLRESGCAGGLATACLAAGGTLGILIPPSIILVIYAIMTEQNIATLFVAAVVPGGLAAVGYVVVIRWVVRRHPSWAPAAAPVPWPLRWQATWRLWPVLSLFVLVVGGIYQGWFTPTEAAAVGAFATGVWAWRSGQLSWRVVQTVLLNTAVTTGMIYMIILGAGLFNGFLALSQLPHILAMWVLSIELSPWWILGAILLFYVVMGCVMDSLSMILLTIPVLFPVVMGLDFGLSPQDTAIWFGVLVLVVVEVGLITPPVGMNLFVIHQLARDVPMAHTYRAVWPFVFSDVVRIALLVAFPAITLFVLP